MKERGNDRKQKGKSRGKAIACGAVLAFVGALSGCAEAKTVQVEITDAYELSRFEAKQGLTVRELLKEAQLELDPQDQVSPGLDEVVSTDQTIDISRSHEVSVVYEDQNPQELTLNGGTVGDAISKAGIVLDQSTSVNLPLEQYLSDGTRVVISKLAWVKVKADGKTYEDYTDAKTVQELLSQLGISLGKRDRISRKKNAKITDGMKIVINRVVVKKESETESIPYETRTEQTASLDVGTTQVKQTGQAGERKLTYRVVYVDGTEESREVIKDTVVTEPVTEIILSGTRQKQQEKAAPSSQGNSGNNGNSGNTSGTQKSSGKTVVSVQELDDCDGSGHGVRITTYSDGTEKVEEY